MGIPEIVAAAVAVLTLILGRGFMTTAWHRRPKILISTFHQAIDGEYQVSATIANAGDDPQHLEEIHLVPVRARQRRPAAPGSEDPIEVDLPPRGRPAKTTFTIPNDWVGDRSDFYVRAKISSRRKPFRSKKQSIDQAVVNVLEIS